MKTFTAWDYLLIDVANHWGLDKKTFEERIEWATAHLDELEDLAKDRIWKERPMYLKTVNTLRKAQAGQPTGHLVGFDAVCSGMQIMSALTGCRKGAEATGLIDTGRRPDAYTDCTTLMVKHLGYHIEGERAKVKQAVMTSLYGSKKEPEKEFGEDTPELDAFYKAMYELCPGPCELLQDLLDSWQPYALVHAWKLPDGYDARVKVMQKREERIEIDELDHSCFTYVWYENDGEKKGVKNAANVVHSIDAYVLRSLVRRCSYDEDIARMASDEFTVELLRRAAGGQRQTWDFTERVAYYVAQYARSGIADVVILEHLTTEDIQAMSREHLKALNRIVNTMLDHPPFELVTVHDDFKCHPNHMNQLRFHYREILAELADSDLIGDLLSQIHGTQGTYQKLSQDLSKEIRQSNYTLC